MTKKETKGKAGTKGPEKPVAGTKESEKSAVGMTEPCKSIFETVEDLEAQYPGLVAEIRDESGPTKSLETAEDLETVYPELVSEIKDGVLEKLGKCTPQQVEQNLPDLYQRIVIDVQNKSGPNLNVPGFLLEVDDPFAEGTLRTYQKLKGIAGMRLPCVLPDKDKFTRPAVESYILRAAGGGDNERAETARKAMKKIK